jgi:hypothetical protein
VYTNRTRTATLYLKEWGQRCSQRDRDNTEYRETGDSTVPKVLWGSYVHAVVKVPVINVVEPESESQKFSQTQCKIVYLV